MDSMIHISWPESQDVPELPGYKTHSIPDILSDVPAYFVEERWWNEQKINKQK